MTTDSHRANADIDPTIFIDDDGTPWMAWGNGGFVTGPAKSGFTIHPVAFELRYAPKKDSCSGNKVIFLCVVNFSILVYEK